MAAIPRGDTVSAMRGAKSVLVTRSYPEGSTQPLYDAALDVHQWPDEQPMSRSRLLQEVSGVQGILAAITERVDQELLDAAPSLEVVAEYGVGYDNIDVPACTRRGVVVCNTPGVLAETTADLTWALILGASRRVGEGIEFVKQGRWQAWSPNVILGRDVHHRTLGVVGLGAIGWQVARRALGFDMRVVYVSTRPHPELEALAPVTRVDLDTLLRESDFVSIHVALTPHTRHLFSTVQFNAMKKTAYLINVARGAVVDQQALFEACRDGAIAGAAIDVTDPEPMRANDPLLTLPNVVVVPHIGSSTIGTRIRMGTLASENIVAVLTGARPPTPVNPEVLDSRPRTGTSL
jgi:glyoxylate reductase